MESGFVIIEECFFFSNYPHLLSVCNQKIIFFRFVLNVKKIVSIVAKWNSVRVLHRGWMTLVLSY